MKTQTEHPFTAQQFNALTEAERQAVLAVAEYLTSSTPEISDEGLSDALNLMKVSDGCVPYEEAGDDLVAAIRRKFAAVYETALELSKAELRTLGFEERKHFNFCLVIEPSSGDSTHVAIVDYDRPVCYLHECCKARQLGFESLAELAKAVLSAKAALVKKAQELNTERKIYVCVEGGVVHQVENLPEDVRVVVIDYDIEGVEKERIERSPVDGERCVINHW